jgi:hypothetical protein
MVNKNVQVSWDLTCDECSNKIQVCTIKEASEAKWYIIHNCYSTDKNAEFDSITKIFCPQCAAKEMIKKYKSMDIRDRIFAGYFNDHPEKWKNDLLVHLGVKLDHPKADLLISKAYEHGHSSGYSEILNSAEDLVDLIL